MPSRDEAAIEVLFHQMAAGWNAGLGSAYAEAFTEDCDYIAFDGTHLKGRQQNADHHQRLFDTVLHGTRLVFESLSTRFLTPDVALVHGRGSVLMPWHRDVPSHRRSIQTYVAVRQPGGWRIAAFHNTRMRPVRLPSGWRLKAILALMRLKTRLSGRHRTERPECALGR